MIKYDIVQNTAKINLGLRYNIIKGCTLEYIENEPLVRKSYADRAAAEEEFSKCTTRIEHSYMGGTEYYTVTEFTLQESEYEGKCRICCNKILKYSPMVIKLTEINSGKIIKTFDNLLSAEVTMNKLMAKYPENDYRLILPDDFYCG